MLTMANCGTTPVKFLLRRDTTTGWASTGAILAIGEPGVNTDTGEMKIGNGQDTWANLPLIGSSFYTKYLLSPPPAPLGLTIDSTNSSQYINVYWQYPTQINAGFLNTGWLPDIIGFGAKLEGILYNGVTQTVDLSSLLTDSRFVNQHNGTNPITLLQLVPYTGTNQYVASVVVGSTSYVGYRIYDPNFSTMTVASGQIRVWYNNYNVSSGSAPYSSTAGPITFNIAKGGPTQPTSLTATDSGTTSGGQNYETITFGASQYANSLNYSDTTAAITSYSYDYALQTTPLRYPAALTDSGTVTITTGLTAPTFTRNTLFNPGSTYLISLRATNNYGSNSSPDVTLTTSLTNYPAQPSVTQFVMDSRYYSSASKVSDGSSVSTLLNLYTDWPMSTPFYTPVHTTTNRGSQLDALATLAYLISGSGLTGSYTFPTSTFNGFGRAGPSTTSSGIVTVTTSTVDTYGVTASSGFYLRSSNTFTVNLSSAAANFTNTNAAYTITTTSTTAGGSPVSCNSVFYYDKITGAPAITSSTISLSAGTTNVSGLQVYAASQSYSNQIICTGMGDYFSPAKVADCSVYITNASTSTTLNTSNALGIGNVSSDSKTGGVFSYSVAGGAKISNVDTNSLFSYAVATISNAGKVYNLVTPAGISFASSSLYIMIDQPSITLVTSTLASSLPTVGITNAFVVGKLIPSGTSLNATTLVPDPWYASTAAQSYGDATYSQTGLLTAGGNNELLIANGKFRTWGTGSYYRDYTAYGNPNYSTITHGSGNFRCATFAWRVDSGNGISFNSIAFSFNNCISNSLSVNSGNTTSPTYITGSAVYPLIYYRFEQQLYTGTDYRIPNGSTAIGGNRNYTSDWLNMNSVANLASGGSYNNLTSTAATPFVQGCFSSVSVSSISGGVNYVFLPNIAYPDTITSSTYLYCRIMLPMNLDFEFASISANLYRT
jgi:hypothetical protein